MIGMERVGRLLLFVSVVSLAQLGYPVLAQTLELSPSTGLVDVPIHFSIRGLAANQRVHVGLEATDATGRRWSALRETVAGAKGEIEWLAGAPASATNGQHHLRSIIAEMQPESPPFAGARFATRYDTPILFSAWIEANGQRIATASALRTFMSAGIEALAVRQGGLVGTLYRHPTAGSRTPVLMLGGSEGGLGTGDMAALLASRGFNVFSLAYFGAEGLPSELADIPLEYFKKAVDFLLARQTISRRDVAVVGTSKGAEAALLLASQHPDVRGVVAYAPSSVAWSCICQESSRASWTVHGLPVPSVGPGLDPKYKPAPGTAVTPVKHYLHRLAAESGLDSKVLPVESIRGPLLLVSGGDDKLWPSDTMAAQIVNRRKPAGPDRPTIHLRYPDAGHLIGRPGVPSGSTLVAGGRIETGGTANANADASNHAWQEVFRFLNSLATDKPGAVVEQSPAQRQLERLEAVASREPNHIGAMYTASRVAAGLGEHQRALRWLAQLEKAHMGDELEPDDFGEFANTAEYKESAARFAKAAPPVGRASSWAETTCADLLPEGTAWDAKRGELLISSGRQRTVFAINSRGQCRRVVPLGEKRLLAVLGMMVDVRTDSLWVVSTAAPFMVEPAPEESGTARLTQIDLTSGKVLVSHRLDGGAMLNDLAMTKDGGIYITDTRGGRVYRLPPDGARLEAILRASALEAPNGIVAFANGDLLVSDFHGLSRVAAPQSNDPKILRLATPNNQYFGGFDGLAIYGDSVVGIQNLIGRARIWILDFDASVSRVTRARLQLRGHPDFLNPTTGAIAGDHFLFVADTKLQSILPHGRLSDLPPGRTGHRVLQINLKNEDHASAAK